MQELVNQIDIAAVRRHCDKREAAHQLVRKLFDEGSVHEFVQLALGISDQAGNYSAAIHEVPQGPKILSKSSESSVFELAADIDACASPNHLPDIIYRHDIPHLKISIGSEIAMMLRPNKFWVGNRRTIWWHLLLKHGKKSRANRELKAWFEGNNESEMDPKVWGFVYLALERPLLDLGEFASNAAKAKKIEPGKHRFLWPDAAATYVFDKHAVRRKRST